MSPLRALAVGLLGLALAAAGCASSVAREKAVACVTDAECGPGANCYAEGCGDTGGRLVVEISGDPRAGQYARDFAIPDGGLTAVKDFPLGPSLVIGGEFQRERSTGIDPNNRANYTEPVLLRAQGVSELLPGVTRSYETRFATTDRGRFSMTVGAGKFALTAVPGDESVPPMTVEGVVVGPELPAPQVAIAFPSIDGALRLSGRLLKKRIAGSPAVDVPLTTVAMDLQAFDPTTRRPLSQRTPVSSGFTGSKGDFILTMNPAAKDLPSIILVASPREAGGLVPTKTFTLSAPLPATATLELGDYGEALPGVAGTVLSGDGAPVVGAQVIVEGPVAGGGEFRSRVVTTDANGGFRLDLLANAPGQSLTLTALPAGTSTSGVFKGPVKVVDKVGAELTLDPPAVKCPDRMRIAGQVLRPSGAAAPFVRVRAVEQGSPDRPLPLDDGETVTDEEGRFQLQLDPGVWRFEYTPGGDLPQASRTVTVPALDPSGLQSSYLALPPLSLRNGSKVTGVVRADTANQGTMTVPYAALRFFQVTSVEGKPASILIGSAVADEKGAYSVALPTR